MNRTLTNSTSGTSVPMFQNFDSAMSVTHFTLQSLCS